jgi:hypothetical protein
MLWIEVISMLNGHFIRLADEKGVGSFPVLILLVLLLLLAMGPFYAAVTSLPEDLLRVVGVH